MSGRLGLVEEMLGAQVNPARRGFFHEALLAVGRDQPVGAPALLRISPAPDADFTAFGHLSHGREATTDCDYGVCRFHHAAYIAIIASYGQEGELRYSQ